MKHSLPPASIRPMRRKDAAAVATMMSGLQAYHGDKCSVTGKDFISHCLGPRKLAYAWLAFVDNRPAGFAIAYDWMNFVKAQKTRTVDLLYVEESFRSSGVGKALMTAIAADALKKGCKRMRLGAARQNRAANAFYKKLGFEKNPSNSHNYKIDGSPLLALTKKTK